MRLWLAEIKKVWNNKNFLLLLILLLCANLLLQWMQTKPKPAEAPPRAYRIMAADLKGLPLEEQRVFIDEKHEIISGVRIVNAIVVAHANGDTYYAQQQQKKYSDVWEKYRLLYESGDYLRYTDTITQEFIFLTEIKAEFSQVYGYEEFLDGLQQKASQYGEISIFADEIDGGFDIQNINKTAEDYAHMYDVDILYTPSKGISFALAFDYTDAIYTVGILLLAASLVSEEKNSGLLTYARSMPAGRLNSAVGKMIAMLAGVLILTVLFFGSNLIFSHLYFGLGPLFRNIQSVPELMYSTLKVDLGTYIGLFGIFKWVAGCILGIASMLFCFVARTTAGDYLLSGLFILSQWSIRWIVPATSKYNVIKYLSMASLMQSNEQLGSYRNLHWFGKPIPLIVVSAVSAFMWCALFCFLFLLIFSKAAVVVKSPKGLPIINWYKRKTHTTLLAQENFKLFIANKAFFILLFFLAIQIFRAGTSVSYIDAEELYYKRYMLQISGPYTMEKYEWLAGESNRLAQEQYYLLDSSGQPNSELPHFGVQPERDAFEKTLSRVSYTNNLPGAELVYETGYLILFDIYDAHDMQQVFLVAMCISFCFCGFFSMETTSGMQEMLRSLPAGRENTLRAKLQICNVTTLFISFVSFLPQWVQVARDYGFNNIFAQLRSIYVFQNVPAFFSIALAMAFTVILRYIGCLLMMHLCSAASHFFKSSFWTVIFTAAVFCLPMILHGLGVRYVRWFGLYPLFHAGAIMSQKNGLFLLLAYVMVCCAAIICLHKYLFKEYREIP